MSAWRKVYMILDAAGRALFFLVMIAIAAFGVYFFIANPRYFTSP